MVGETYLYMNIKYYHFISVILQGFLGWNPKYKGGKGGKLSM
jgi:hypothetical protein